MKKIYTIGQDAPFLDRLAREILRRAGGDALSLSRYLILLPTRRACRAMGEAFARAAGGKPTLLPRMRPLGDIDEDEISFAEASAFEDSLSHGGAHPDLPPAIGSLKRLMLLTRQVQLRDPQMSCDQAAQAAGALARFLDQAEIERLDFARLPDLVEEQDLAEHWQQTVQFLDIVTRNWPAILAEQGALDPAVRRNKILAAQTDLWRAQPPDFPVIAAGSTGSIPATRDLLDIVAGLPQGAVILPGLDRAMDNEAWDRLDDTHPQHGLKKLLASMKVGRDAVRDWAEDENAAPPPAPRLKLLSEAMRPADLTESWRGLRGKLGMETVAGLTRLTLDHPQEEAQVIALRLRALLEEPGKNAAFVTADRGLAQRVAALLRRWDIEIDDSGGTPLAALPLGAFLNLTLAAAASHAGARDRLALLKHPFAACGRHPAACREQARAAEVRLRGNEGEDFTWLAERLAPLAQNWLRKLPVAAHIAAHVAAAEAVAESDGESGAQRLWRGDIGEGAAQWLEEWRESMGGFPPLSGESYAALFGLLSNGQAMRPLRATHPRIQILGPLEARLLHADLVILGGMNEGVWPPDAGFDPWMSRPMRKKFGLPSPEFRIGLAAHDFTALAAAPEVLLTRAARAGGSPSVPSRFLLQIDAVLRAAGLSDDMRDALAPAEPWRDWARALDAPTATTPCPRPLPRPPADSRPAGLAVTEIGTWLRNPYAIYARHILKLKRLEDIDAALDAADRGKMIHEALEKFLVTWPDALPDDAEAELLEIGRKIFAREAALLAHGDPRIQAFWWASFTSIAGWFAANEYARRAEGIQTVRAEAEGRLLLSSFTLRGRADRIDRLPDGTLAIIDYKTGSAIPTGEVKAGREPQLPLLALIAAAGGFGDVGAAASGSLEYWNLKGNRSGSRRDTITDRIGELVVSAEAGLKQLIAAYADPAMPYRAVPRPGMQPRHNDYAHLSRLAEWGRTGDAA